MAKRRFGVSLSEEIASWLDKVSRALSTDRSSLVERAVKAMLDDYEHLLSSHECSGVLLIACKREPHRGFARVIEGYRDITTAHIHAHLEEDCIDLVIVSGPSEKIMKLHEEIESSECKTRFIHIP
ncbi:MAG: ribbon-helix-helix domain-containing protein [Desulfurococcales archaeon]|nr:ribbon-helix-helix domain-containing protein [Desulfurococcales archaeon]